VRVQESGGASHRQVCLHTSSDVETVGNIFVTILQDDSVSFEGEYSNLATANSTAVVSDNVCMGILFEEFQDLCFFKSIRGTSLTSYLFSAHDSFGRLTKRSFRFASGTTDIHVWSGYIFSSGILCSSRRRSSTVIVFAYSKHPTKPCLVLFINIGEGRAEKFARLIIRGFAESIQIPLRANFRTRDGLLVPVGRALFHWGGLLPMLSCWGVMRARSSEEV